MSVKESAIIFFEVIAEIGKGIGESLRNVMNAIPDEPVVEEKTALKSDVEESNSATEESGLFPGVEKDSIVETYLLLDMLDD